MDSEDELQADHLLKMFMETLGHDIEYRLVTNTTLLDNEKIGFFNRYKMTIIISYDGEESERDFSVLPNFAITKKLNHKGLTSVYYSSNASITKMQKDIDAFRLKYWNEEAEATFFPNFAHQTEGAPNPDLTHELAEQYVQELGLLLEYEFIRYYQNRAKGELYKDSLNILKGCFNRWRREHDGVRGTKCFNENVYVMAIDGNFFLCPYSHKTKLGDIYHDVDWDHVESFLPEKCRDCKIRHICMNSCVANITDNECYISRVMYKHINKLMEKYQVSYQELVDFISKREEMKYSGKKDTVKDADEV